MQNFKQQLMARDEASELFARERGDDLAALLGNLAQTVFGAPAYPDIERANLQSKCNSNKKRRP